MTDHTLLWIIVALLGIIAVCQVLMLLIETEKR